MSTITFWLEGSEIKMRFPYDEGFIDDLKHTFCAAWRSYDPTTRIWGVTATKWPALRELARRHFLHIEAVGELAPMTSVDVATDELAAILPDLPRAVVDKVYRLILAEVHPDRGGSLDLSQRVGEAYAKHKRG
jgi:hypothetical protein